MPINNDNPLRREDTFFQPCETGVQKIVRLTGEFKKNAYHRGVERICESHMGDL